MSRWDDNTLVLAIAILATGVAGRKDPRMDLAAWGPYPCATAARRELGRHNEPLVIHSDVQLPPVPVVPRRLVPLHVPLTSTQDLETRGIDDQVDRAVVGWGQGRHLNVLVPARECGVVRSLDLEVHQAQELVQEALGLAKWEAEDDSQCQGGRDCEV